MPVPARVRLSLMTAGVTFGSAVRLRPVWPGAGLAEFFDAGVAGSGGGAGAPVAVRRGLPQAGVQGHQRAVPGARVAQGGGPGPGAGPGAADGPGPGAVRGGHLPGGLVGVGESLGELPARCGG